MKTKIRVFSVATIACLFVLHANLPDNHLPIFASQTFPFFFCVHAPQNGSTSFFSRQTNSLNPQTQQIGLFVPACPTVIFPSFRNKHFFFFAQLLSILLNALSCRPPAPKVRARFFFSKKKVKANKEPHPRKHNKSDSFPPRPHPVGQII